MKATVLGMLLLLNFLNLSAATIKSQKSGGIWSEATTWDGGTVPIATDDVVISAGSLVTITSSTVCGGLRIEGILAFTGGPFTVNGDVLVDIKAQFRTWAGGSLSVLINGNLINNGLTDLSRNGAVLRLGAPASAKPTEISGTGSFAKGVVRTLRIDNPSGVSLTLPISISGNLGLWNGVFETKDYLTLNNLNPGNGKELPSVIVERKKGSLSNKYKVATGATVVD